MNGHEQMQFPSLPRNYHYCHDQHNFTLASTPAVIAFTAISATAIYRTMLAQGYH